MASTPSDGPKPGEGGSGDAEYDRKFQELQKYIPFLKGMMRKLEHSSDKLRAAQLRKMQNLYGLLTNPQKRLKLETLEKCEDVLNKLQEKLKFENQDAAEEPILRKITRRGPIVNPYSGTTIGCFGPGKSSGKLDNFDSDQDSSASTSQAQSSAQESESKNVPFICDSDSKSNFTSRDDTSAGTSSHKFHEDHYNIPTSSRHENNMAFRFKDNFKSDATMNINSVQSEPFRPRETIPCLESPSSPTHFEPVPPTTPVRIPLERKEPLPEGPETLNALQESRERLKKIMTTESREKLKKIMTTESREKLKKVMSTQEPYVPPPPRRDSFTQPSFTVCQPSTPVPEVMTSPRDNPPGAFERPTVPPSPYRGNVGASSYTGNAVPPSPYTGNAVPPSPYTGNAVPPSSYTGNAVPFLPYAGNTVTPSFACNAVPPSPHLGNALFPSPYNAVPPSPYRGSVVPPSPYRGNTVPPSPFTGHAIPPSPYTGHAIPPSPYTGNAESRMGFPTPVPSPYPSDRMGTPARSDIDPDFPFLQKNASYLTANKEAEFLHLKKSESFLSSAPSSTVPINAVVNHSDDTNRSMSLRAKLGQAIDTLHKVGVSTGGALRTLIHKDDKKGIEKKEDSVEKEKTDNLAVADIDKQQDTRRNSIESQPNLGSNPGRVDPRRSSLNSTEVAADEGVWQSNFNLGLQPRNEMGLHNMDNFKPTRNQVSPSEEGRNLVQPTLMNDRTAALPLLDLPFHPTTSPRFSEPKPNPGPNDPYPPVKPDLYSRSQNNQRPHVVCTATPFAQNRLPPSRNQSQKKALLPTPLNRLPSPWGTTGTGAPRHTSAHELGFRYSHRSNAGQNTAEKSRTETAKPKQGTGMQLGRPFDSRSSGPEKDASSALFTPDPQTRPRGSLPDKNSPVTFIRRENADAKALKDSANDKFRATDSKKREERDEKQDQCRNKDRNKEASDKSREKGKQDNFSSPLGSLYEGVSQSKTGVGYGKQTFKIPKKKEDPPKSESKPPVQLQSPPATGNKIPVLEHRSPALENRSPVPLKSPPLTGNKIPVLGGRLSPLRDPRTIRSKSRPPSPVLDSPIPGTPPVWGVDASAVHGTIPNIVSSEFPCNTQSMRPNQTERLATAAQLTFHTRNRLDNSSEDGSDRFRRDSRSPVDRMSRGRSRPFSPSDRSRARCRAGSRSPYRSTSRGQSPERSKSRARSRPRSRTPERSKSRARSRGRSKTPERSKSRARSRPRSKTPERSKSRARSRPRSKTPERCKSRGRSRSRSKTPERSKSRCRSRPRSRTPERSKSRGRLRDVSRSPERRRPSRSPAGRTSRARSRGRSVSPSETRPTMATCKGSSPDTAVAPPERQERSRSGERSVSGRSTSQESRLTADSGNYSSRSRRRDRSNDRVRTRDRTYYRAKSPITRRSRSRSRGRSKTRGSSRDRKYPYSRSRRMGRGRSPSPRRRSLSRTRRSSRGRGRSRSRTPSREIESATDIKPQQTEISSEAKSSPTPAASIEPDVSSTSDSQLVEVKSEAESKEASSAQSTDKAKIDSSAQSAAEPSKSSEKVEDKLAVLKNILGNADVMKYLLDNNFLNLSAVGNLNLGQSESVQTSKTEPSVNADANNIPTSSAPAETPVAVEAPEDAAEGTKGVPTADTSKEVEDPEDSQTSIVGEDMLINDATEEIPLSKLIKAPKTRRNRKKQAAKKPKRGRRNSSAVDESSVERKPQDNAEEKQSQTLQPRRRGKNELERLQEDIREMFISAEVVTATGQRTCRVRREAQEQGSKSRNSSTEKNRADADVDFKTRPRSRGDESKALNTSSDSGRSVDAAEAGPIEEDQIHKGAESDDDTPLNVLQKHMDVRSSPVSDSSPIRLASKKRKYNLIDSETESEVDDGRVSSCSVVVEKIAPLNHSIEGLPRRLPSRNMARRGKKIGFSNIGNRRISQEEPKPAAAEDDVDKSLIDCNNIINWPDKEANKKLTRRQLKMRLRGEHPKSSSPNLEISSQQSLDNEVVSRSTKASTSLVNFNTATEASNRAVSEESVLHKTDVSTSCPASENYAKTDGLQDFEPTTFIKSEPLGHDESPQQLPSNMQSLVEDFVFSKNMVNCRHCSWKGKLVVSHYKCTHPDAEIDYSRFPMHVASKLNAESETEGLTFMSELELSAKFPLSKPPGRYLLRCVLCRTLVVPTRFVKHFSLHTGEYHYRCGSCTYTAPSKEHVREHFAHVHTAGKRPHISHVVEGRVNPLNVALVYTCSLCNFFQLQRSSVENHIKSAHPTDEECPIKRVAVTELVKNKDIADEPAVAAEVHENTPEVEKENEPGAEVPTDKEPSENLSEDTVSAPLREQSASMATPSISQPDKEAAHPEASTPCSSTQPQGTPASGNSPRVSTAPVVDNDKAVDLSVFISSDPLKSQEQQIEEERLKKLKDAGEALRNRPVKPRSSILDLIAERINAPAESLAADSAAFPPRDVPQGLAPLPTLRTSAARRTNKSLMSVGPQSPVTTDTERKITRQQKPQDAVTEDLYHTLPSSVPSLSAGELNSTVELMRKKIESPIIARNKPVPSIHQFRNPSVVDDTITVSTVFKMRDPVMTSVRVGDVEVRKGSDEGTLYICHGDNCLFTSSLPKLYVEHLATDHHRWRVRQTCSACQHELVEEGDMVYAFNHIKSRHLTQEFPINQPQPARRLPPVVPLLRTRRMPGDKLSTPGLALRKAFTEPAPESQAAGSSDPESIPQPETQPETTPEEAAQPEDEPASFCRIENVVSLSSLPPPLEDVRVDVETAEEGRSATPPPLVPLQRSVPPPAVPLSPQSLSVLAVFVDKTPESKMSSSDEITPTTLAKLNPVQMNTPRNIGKVSFKKESSVAAAMHTPEKLRHFFKCTGRRCSYSTNIKNNFVYHYSMHVSKESESGSSNCKFEWNKCIYCGTEESSGGRLTEHMIQFHGDCCFQCAYCLYRAAYQANVVFHQTINHSLEPVVVLECRRVAESPQIPKPTQKIEFYQCAQAPVACREEFFFADDFKYHLRAKHSDDKYKCGLCTTEFGSPEHLVLHCNVKHSIRTYHCLYCRKAAETQKEMSHHLCYDHPEEAIVVAARTRSDVTENSTVERGEFDKNQKIQTIRLDDVKANSLDYLVKLRPLPGGSLIVPSEETDDPKQEVAFDNDKTKEEKSTTDEEVIILSDEDPPKEPKSQLVLALQSQCRESSEVGSSENTPPDLQKTDPQSSEPKKNEERALTLDELVAKVRKDIENTGLVGKALYRCGHTDCSYTADTISQLKDHMYVCDFSRNSPALVCVHCSRAAKTVEALMEHLRSHGLHRYSCGSCDFRAATVNLITNHMKKTHYFTEYNVVPLHPLQKDPDKSLFTVYAKDVAVGKRRTKKLTKAVYTMKAALANDTPATAKVAFSPDEIALLPHSAVFPKPYRCSICNYSNKVRCNLVRHLQQHAAGKEASPISVVNPVPHLERNNGEKMFDTMTNHAVSSNTPRRDSTTSAKELEELPKFVPEQARYACSVCSSVTSEDTLYLHLTTLHPELKDVGYHCPHCRERAIPAIPLDRSMIPHHLKMHDTNLYKCPYCTFHHYHRHHVQRHTSDKHSDQAQYLKTVREDSKSSQSTSESSSEQIGQECADPEAVVKEQQVVVFECGICGWEGPRADVLNHARTVHEMYNSLKCTSCEYGTNIRKNFALHFRKKHDGVPQQVISILKKVVKSSNAASKSNREKRIKELPTPSWQLQKGHAKHVRGIMFEENGPKPRELEHGDFGEMSLGKRSYSSDHRDGPEPKKIYSGLPSRSSSISKDEPREKYRCPKCCFKVEMTENQFRIHILEESESSSWLCHICSKASENFSYLVKHYANEHMIADELSVMRSARYDSKVTDLVNRTLAKHQKAKEAQSRSPSHDAGTSRVTRTSRSLASSPVAWTAGSASENSCDGFQMPKKAKAAPASPIKFLPAPLLSSPPRNTPSPANILTPTTLKKITVVKPMSLPGTSRDDFEKRLLNDQEDIEINIEEVEEDSRSNEEWERFEKPAEYQCSYCGTSYPSREELQKHVQSDHGSDASPLSATFSASITNRRYSCDYCDYTCKTRFDKRNHEMRHWQNKPFKCGHCDSQFIRESEGRKHSAKVHPDKTHLILENDISSAEQTFVPLQRKRKLEKGPSSALKSKSPPDSPDAKASENVNVSEDDYRHVLYPTAYRCSHCPRRTTSLSQLKIHVDSNHRDDYVANFVFKHDKLNFLDIVNSKHPFRFRCGMCQHTGTLVTLSDQHYKSYHPNCPIVLRGCIEKVFQCGLCTCYYSGLFYLSRHFEKRHAGEVLKYKRTTIDPDLETRQYKCLWCNELMSSLQELAQHHDRFHCHLKPSYKEMECRETSMAEEQTPASGESMLAEEPEVGQESSSPVVGPKSSKVKPRAVAKKSTSKQRSVARKSTSSVARACVSNVNYMDAEESNEESDGDVTEESRDGTSFYGRPTSPVDVKRVTCPIQIGAVTRRVNVATVAQEMDLHPVVVCVDVSDDSSPNSQPFDSSYPM